ncbi:hypothetical protein, partial [Phocaeicola abscessus]|uniref:hypothetical protein n=1 Tax=Phocaeicola abscessus TaxID=555313 RepID=UPI0028E2B378
PRQPGAPGGDSFSMPRQPSAPGGDSFSMSRQPGAPGGDSVSTFCRVRISVDLIGSADRWERG